MTLQTVACDLCGGQDFQTLYPGTITDPDHEPASYFSSSRTRAGHLPIVRCAGCGLVMSNPQDDPQTLQRVYPALHDPAYAAEERNRRRTAQAYLRFVHCFCPRPGALLDVGCATGIFACEAARHGWQVTGLEPSAWSLAQARHRCPQPQWINSLLENAEFAPGSFQVVTLWDVLEHVPSPTRVLSLVRTWLAPGGWVFLNLPNSASLIARLSGPHWVLFLREHLWYFSPATMRRLLDKTGFTLVHTRSNFVRFSLWNVAARLEQYRGLPGRVGSWLSGRAAARRFHLTFPIGEMNVAARVNPAD